MPSSLNVDSITLKRCPHCGIANAQFLTKWQSGQPIKRADGGKPSCWGTYSCTTCGHLVVAKGAEDGIPDWNRIVAIYPKAKTASNDIPEVPRSFLQQAYETLHAPDAAAVMAGSAVDAMLKAHDYKEGSVYKRIELAVEDHLLTEAMGEWAHSVRLGSNRPRHADEENPNVTAEEAKQSVEFAEALAQFLFVLTAKINAGIASAKGAEDAASED